MAQPILIVDADPDCYRAAYAGERTTEWAPGEVSVDVDWSLCELYLREAVNKLKARFKPMGMVWCFSDPKVNWRKLLCPTYKANRNNTMKPVMLDRCKEFLLTEMKGELWPALEADDVVGILSQSTPGNVVVVSIDKDMRTLPGKLFRPGKKEVEKVRVKEACLWHMTQTLIGDSTDGYPGCPGIGPKKAEKILVPLFEKVGRRIGVGKEQLYKEAWEQGIVPAFEEKGLSEADALLQARLAHILNDPEEYDRGDNGPVRVRLWSPPGKEQEWITIESQ